MVNPAHLWDVSDAFRELYQPYINQPNVPIHLSILDSEFSERCIKNFFNLCQNLPADVQDSEVEEICAIAQMFKAEKIYQTGLDFVKKNVDPQFYIPENKYENTQIFLKILKDEKPIHIVDINSTSYDSNVQSNIQQTTIQEPKNNNKLNNQNEPLKKIETIIYNVRIDVPLFKCVRFFFTKGQDLSLSAKQKDNEIIMAKGSDIHINSHLRDHIGHIIQDGNGSNQVTIGETFFRVKYFLDPTSHFYSIGTSFIIDGKKIDWTPKKLQYSPDHEIIDNSLQGNYHHLPIFSKYNTVLQNSDGQTVFIVRKMDDHFEVECDQDIEPEFVFALTLSQLAGPYNEQKHEITPRSTML